MRRMKDQGELFQLAMRVKEHVKEKFPDRLVSCAVPKICINSF